MGAALLVLITAGVVTFLNRKSDTDALAKETEAVSVPTVAVVQAQAEAGNDELVLPGNLQAFEESPIFARTNGYLIRWYKDMGSKVQKDELLAAIDTPESGIRSSPRRKASREQIKAAMALAKIYCGGSLGESAVSPTRCRNRRLTSNQAAIHRRKPIWRPRMRTSAVSSNWSPSKMSTLHFRAC